MQQSGFLIGANGHGHRLMIDRHITVDTVSIEVGRHHGIRSGRIDGSHTETDERHFLRGESSRVLGVIGGFGAGCHKTTTVDGEAGHHDKTHGQTDDESADHSSISIGRHVSHPLDSDRQLRWTMP